MEILKTSNVGISNGDTIQNRMVQTTENFEPFDKKKKTFFFFLTIFDKVLMPLWKTFL